MTKNIYQDAQVKEALSDIKRSEEQITSLKSLYGSGIPEELLDNLIEFHTFRINNCTDALSRVGVE